MTGTSIIDLSSFSTVPQFTFCYYIHTGTYTYKPEDGRVKMEAEMGDVFTSRGMPAALRSYERGNEWFLPQNLGRGSANTSTSDV